MANPDKKIKFLTNPKEWHVRARNWWNIMILSFSVLLLLAIIFNLRNFWVFRQSENAFEDNFFQSSLKLDSAKLESVLKRFEQKALNSNEIINSKSPVSDPSL